MTIEEESVEFLQDCIESDFSDLFNHFIIKEIEWLEFDNPRPIAFLKDNKGNKSNLICLFPPFIPNTSNK